MMMSQIEPTLNRSISVKEIETEDGAVLLDIHRGVCIGLTPVAAQIWREFGRNISADQIAANVSSEFNISHAQARTDVNDFLEALARMRLLEQPRTNCGPRIKLVVSIIVAFPRIAGRNPTKRSARRFLKFKAFLGLLAFDVLRLGRNFNLLYELVCRWRTSQVLPPVEKDVVTRVCRALDYACLWYPKRALCLQRSVVRTCLLRSAGINAHLVLGAQTLPFKAHAWTEIDGTSIHERRDVKSRYLVWDKL